MWLLLIVILYLVLKNIFKKTKGRRDYSLGFDVAIEAASLVKEKDYDRLEAMIRSQEINDVTQIIDHLALLLNEQELEAWKLAKESDISKLSLGVFYLHLAWIRRSHKLANNVTTKRKADYFTFLSLCQEQFDAISIESYYSPELYSRLIRLYMSMGDNITATEYFKKVRQSHPDFIWPYLHYAEMVQPKWGGYIEDLESFYESLPDNYLIHSIVELKLILDSFIMKDNYFSKYNRNLKEFAKEKLKHIDDKLCPENTDTIHKYVLYNYLEEVAKDVKQGSIRKKYKKLKNGYNTLYPHGLLD